MGGKGRQHDKALRVEVLSLLAWATSQGAGWARCCEVLGLSLRTVQRWQRGAASDQRRGPRNAPAHQLSEAEKDEIVRLANQPAYRNLSPEQVVAKLADEGTYICSERSLRRVLAERKLDRHRQRSKPRTPRHKPREYVAHGPLQVLSWDITYLKNATVRGSYFYLYLYVDIWSRRIVAAEVHDTQCSKIAAGLLSKLCAEHGMETDGLVVHSDNGGPMKGSTMLATIYALGIIASFSRPRVSDDNAFIEALFRHLKYAPSYPAAGFQDLEAARAWVERFVTWYNTEHLHSAIALVTPDDRHHGRDIAILDNRRSVYAAARLAHPRRWTGPIRPWCRPTTVTLNPERIIIPSPKFEVA